jgi:hypothetical protein
LLEAIIAMRQNIEIKVALVTAALAMLFATATFADESAQGLNYTYIELDYVYGKASVESDSSWLGKRNFHLPEGVALKGSILLVDQLLVRGSYYYSDENTWKDTADVDVTSGVVSVGWLVPTEDGNGIDISLDYRTDELEYKPKSGGQKLSPDIDGFGISFGVRAAPSKNTEIGLRAGWYQGDFDGAVGVVLNFAWNINDRWGLNLSYDRMDSDPDIDDVTSYVLEQYQLGGRFYF